MPHQTQRVNLTSRLCFTSKISRILSTKKYFGMHSSSLCVCAQMKVALHPRLLLLIVVRGRCLPISWTALTWSALFVWGKSTIQHTHTHKQRHTYTTSLWGDVLLNYWTCVFPQAVLWACHHPLWTHILSEMSGALHGPQPKLPTVQREPCWGKLILNCANISSNTVKYFEHILLPSFG